MTAVSAFSAANDRLQVAWDATSLKALQRCPRYYEYTILDGWSPYSIHLGWGRVLASGLEIYQKGRLAGLNREDAILPAVRYALEDTWHEDGTQDFGEWVTKWHCLGEVPFRNAKGNVAKCPYSHKGKWFENDAPPICSCGSAIESETQYVPEDRNKNRITLIRSLIWYAFNQPENFLDGLHPYVFEDGTPAIELSFAVPIDYDSRSGEPFYLAGHMDYVGQLGTAGPIFPVDNKSTGKQLDYKFFAGYSPDTQFDTYDMVMDALFPGLQSGGVAIDAIHPMPDAVEFGRQIYYKDEELRAEHHDDLLVWLQTAENYALTNYWPMNKGSCWLCPFKKVCSLPKSEREAQLAFEYVKRERWDPLVPRN